MARISADGQEYTATWSLGTQAALTVCGWFQIVTDRNDYSTIFSIDNGTGDNWLMQTGVDGTTMNTVFDATTQQSMGAMTVGTWYFICLATNGTTGTIYYRTPATQTMSTVAVSGATASVSAVNFRIGESPWGAEWWNGRINAVRAWTAQLSAAEVGQESQQYVPKRLTNLVAFHPLVRPETTDYSGNARTLSGGSGATREDGPPIPWDVLSPQLFLPAPSSGTTAAAETASATASALDATSAVTVAAQDAAATASVDNAAAVTSVVAAAEAATATAAANNTITTIVVDGTSASASATVDNPSASVAATAENASSAGAAHDATVVTGSVTTATAEAATAAATAQNPTISAAATAEAATAATANTDAAAAVTVQAENAAAAGSGLDPNSAVTATPTTAAATGLGLDPTIATTGGTTATAQTATAGAAAHDPTVLVSTNVLEAAASATAEPPAAVVVVLAQAQTATGAAVAHDPGVSIVVSIGAAEAEAVAWDADVPAQVSRGVMSPGSRPAPEMSPTVRATSTMTGG